MQLCLCRFIFSFDKTITIDVDGTDTIREIKNSVEEKLGVPSNHQNYRFGGRQLLDDCSLNEHGIRAEATLQLVLLLRGGMFQPDKFRSSPPYATICMIYVICSQNSIVIFSFFFLFVFLLTFF